MCLFNALFYFYLLYNKTNESIFSKYKKNITILNVLIIKFFNIFNL